MKNLLLFLSLFAVSTEFFAVSRKITQPKPLSPQEQQARKCPTTPPTPKNR